MKIQGARQWGMDFMSRGRHTAGKSASVDDSSPHYGILAVGCPPAFTEALASLLASRESVNLLSVCTGGAARELLRGNRIDVIVLNVGIPDIDARDLFTDLREAPETATIPVLFVGSHIIESVRNHPCRMAFDGDLTDDGTPSQAADWIGRRLREQQDNIVDTKLDPLTRLENRATFCHDFIRITETYHMSHEPVSLAMISIAHPGGESEPSTEVGDCCVHRLATGLISSLRSTDYLVRWSRRVFVVLLAGEDAMGATRAIEKALEEASQRLISNCCGENAASLSLSAGVTTVTPGMTGAVAIASAERYLFRARTAGGNRVSSTVSRLYRRPDHALILIDDKLLGRVIKNLLEHAEMKVVHATTIREALDACGGSQRFQLIVIDECLNKGEGFKALEQVKALPRNRPVPTIMVLAEHSEARIERAMKLGASDYAGRPFAPIPFVSRVRKLMENGMNDQDGTTPCYRILIVDHSLDDLILVGATLHQHSGLRVYLAYGTKDVRERLVTQPVDIIMVPLEMLREQSPIFVGLFSSSLTPDVAVVGTSDSDGAPLGEPYDKRIKGVIRKPFNVMTLGDQLAAITGISAEAKSTGSNPDHLNDEIKRILTLSAQPPA